MNLSQFDRADDDNANTTAGNCLRLIERYAPTLMRIGGGGLKGGQESRRSNETEIDAVIATFLTNGSIGETAKAHNRSVDWTRRVVTRAGLRTKNEIMQQSIRDAAEAAVRLWLERGKPCIAVIARETGVNYSLLHARIVRWYAKGGVNA